jgi:hypothetical protein
MNTENPAPVQRFNHSTIQRLPLRFICLRFFWVLGFGIWDFGTTATAATVTGNLKDISVQPLTTKLLFTPTTNVLVTGSGLSAGPPKMITTASGAFSLDLEAGDYTVTLPLITYRAPFRISVPDSVSTLNITNLLSPPITYTYTNWLATGPLHVNTSRVTVWSTNGLQTLLDSSCTLPAGALAAGKVITIEAFGSSADPGPNGADLTFTLKLGSTTIWTQTKTSTASNWHLRALITVRSAGTSGSVAASAAITQENATPDLFPFTTTVTTLNTTTSLAVSVSASITDFTGTESVICDQLLITFY